ncbi:MAG: type II toxin-antitoxin system prevent-host-death family antitoxin [Actinomycetales bacterium]|mgnify:FL=1|jgi:prevent-host-death family protein|nr:type II toxin-antitoxin system prevent-host-death family antitoxin [Candidatus Phosphoribacter baldrii]MBK6954919.1 type II toxin-antitoxin system prevent-host-death family antitoxin [Candidatus Phosphoribacter baldrii]MBK7612488.1 type II toxin-antitoxin system prevent-host-death family antitoxin [Candidatus Phosphoribacter baldrii]
MTTTTVGAYEAKTHLPALLAQVERGETVTITRHGRPIARLIPIDIHRPAEQIFVELDRLRQGVTTGGMSIREMIEEGRRR